MTGIVIDQSSPQSLIIPNTLQLTVTISPSDASNKTIIWSSSDTSRATVNTNGVVTARGTSNGTATITATTQDGGFTAQCTINVTFIPVTGVVIDQSSPQSLSIPNTLQLTATISPPNASNKIVIWSSSDTSRATVNTNGVVTARGTSNGTATITATTQDGGFTAQCTINVTFIPVTGITLNKSSTSIILGEKEQLIATISPADASDKSVSWTSTNPVIASVDADGLVSANALDPSPVTITATAVNGGQNTPSANCNVTVVGIPVTGVSLNKSATTIYGLGTEQLIATVIPSNATNKNVTWSDGGSNAISVDSNGLVTSNAVGSGVVTVTTDDGGYTDTCNVTVAPVSVTGVSVLPTELWGVDGQLTATVIPSNATNKNVTWSTNNPAVATVNSSGYVTFNHGFGDAIITVTTVDGGYTATCIVHGY